MNIQKVNFPTKWEFRLISLVEKKQEIKNTVINLIPRKNFYSSIYEGNFSKNKTYISLHIPLIANSKKDLDHYSLILKKIEGVKFVL